MLVDLFGPWTGAQSQVHVFTSDCVFTDGGQFGTIDSFMIYTKILLQSVPREKISNQKNTTSFSFWARCNLERDILHHRGIQSG